MAITRANFVGHKPSMLPELVIVVARELDDKYTYDIKISKHADKKTVSQNAYFHKLIDTLRLEMNCSFTRMKNEMVASYGAILSDELIMLSIAPDVIREWERPHVKYVSSETVTDKYGVKIEGHWYRLYKNVADMNTYEMAKLITGTVQECENLGLDVITPDERAYLNEILKGHEHEARVDSC
jgi:hypothetical protein